MVKPIYLLVTFIILISGCISVVPSPTDDFVVPGLTDENVENFSELEKSHKSYLDNNSFKIVRNYTQKINDENYSYYVNHNTTVLVGKNWSSFYYKHISDGASNGSKFNYIDTAWLNNTIIYYKVKNLINNTVRYEKIDPEKFFSESSYMWTNTISNLQNGNVSNIKRDNNTYYRVFVDLEKRNEDFNIRGRRNISGFVQAYITPDGFMKKYLYKASFDSRKGSVNVTNRLNYTLDIEETKTPSWYKKAVRNTSSILDIRRKI